MLPRRAAAGHHRAGVVDHHQPRARAVILHQHVTAVPGGITAVLMARRQRFAVEDEVGKAVRVDVDQPPLRQHRAFDDRVVCKDAGLMRALDRQRL